MSNNWQIKDHTEDRWIDVDSRKEGEDKLEDFEGELELELKAPDGRTVDTNFETDDTDDVDAEIVDHSMDGDPGTPAAKQSNPKADGGPQTQTGAEIVGENKPESPQEPTETAVDDALDELGDSLETDPLSILPGHMIDTIQGQPAINKRGYAMIAERYGVEVQSHIEEYPWDNDGDRCVARATAKTEDGKEYQDYATASADDGDMEDQLIELASTRALKRVTGWSTGLGIVSYQELTSELES